VGDGDIVHAGESSEGDIGVNKMSLKDYSKKYDFKALRVKASPKDRKEAVKYVKQQLGNDFNVGGMLKLLLPFKGSADGKKRARKALSESFFCSELVANSYNNLNMAKKKHLKHVWPGDIYRSPYTKRIAELRKASKER